MFSFIDKLPYIKFLSGVCFSVDLGPGLNLEVV